MEEAMLKAGILWWIGVPISLIVVLMLLGVF
jgi:hypothetical protein